MNARKYHWCKTSLLSLAVYKHVVPKDFIFRKSLVLYPPNNEGIIPYQKFFMSENFNMWVAVGKIVLWVSGSNGLMVQPWITMYTQLPYLVNN